MSENSSSIKEFELESSKRNIQLPIQYDTDNELLDSMIDRATRFAKYEELEERIRNEIVKKINREIQSSRDKIAKVFGIQFFEDFNQPLEKFKLGELNLYDLHERLIKNYLLEQDIDSEIIAVAFEIQREIFHLLKSYLNIQLPLNGNNVTDDIIKKFRTEENDESNEADDFDLEKISQKDKFAIKVQEALHTILEFLKPISRVKGVGIVYNEPYTKKPHEFIEGDVQQRRIEYLVGEESSRNEKDENGPIKFGKKGQEESHLILEMEFGARKIGYIDFVFEGEYVDPIIEKTCKQVKGRIDDFLDDGLQKVLIEKIHEEQLKILDKFFLDEWRDICTEFLKIINTFSENPVLVCKRFDLLTPGYSEITKDGEVETTTPDKELSQVIIDKAKKLKDINSKSTKIINLRYPSFLDHDDLVKKGIDPKEAELMGAIIAEVKNDSQGKMLTSITKQLEDILKRREELRHRFIQAFGLQVANAYLDGQLETMGEHEIVILIGDVTAYSKFTQAIAEAVKKNLLPENLVPEIMNIFTEEISEAIDRDTELKGVLDKIIGDALIVFFAPPFDHEGRDIDCNKDGEQNMPSHILKGLRMCSKIQKVFRNILEKIEKKYGIKLPWYPLFSYGLKKVKDVVGIFGNIKNPYSRLDYTAFGTGINETARIQAAAPAGGVLVDYKTWKILEDSGVDEFIQIGLPFLVRGKNIKDPLPVVLVVPVEQLLKTQEKQEEFLTRKSIERNNYRKKTDSDAPYFYCTENDSSSLPDGDYIVTGTDVEEKGLAIINLAFGNHHFTIKIDRDDIDNVQYPVSIEMENELIQERDRKHFSRRTLLRKKGDKFLLINHVCIEKIVAERLKEITERNEAAGKEYIGIDSLETGKYKILDAEEQEDGDLIFTLMRGRTNLKLILKSEDNDLQGPVLQSGFLIHTQGICVCEPDELKTN